MIGQTDAFTIPKGALQDSVARYEQRGIGAQLAAAIGLGLTPNHKPSAVQNVGGVEFVRRCPHLTSTADATLAVSVFPRLGRVRCSLSARWGPEHGSNALHPRRCRCCAQAVIDGIVGAQGPNYILSKRMQAWRAMTARAAGQRVSINVAPSTATASVVSVRCLPYQLLDDAPPIHTPRRRGRLLT
jgi:hypothetical protein